MSKNNKQIEAPTGLGEFFGHNCTILNAEGVIQYLPLQSNTHNQWTKLP